MFLGLAITDNNLLQNEGDTSVKDENDIDEFNYESPLPITIEIECDQLSLSENDEVDKFLCVVCYKVFNTVAEQHEHTHSPVVYTTGKFTTLDVCDYFQSYNIFKTCLKRNDTPKKRN